MAQDLKGASRARPRATDTTCWHSSDVGVSTSARGAFLRWGCTSREEASCARRRCTRGARYASVFPLPAWSRDQQAALAVQHRLHTCRLFTTRGREGSSGLQHGRLTKELALKLPAAFVPELSSAWLSLKRCSMQG